MYALAAKHGQISEAEEVDEEGVDLQLAFADELRCNTVTQSLETQAKRKERYGCKVHGNKLKAGQLVMTLNQKVSEDAHSTKRKLRAKWLGPCRITTLQGTSCRVETLEGIPIAGRFNLNRVKKVVLAPTPDETRALRQAETEARKS
jgi:hypothetical protein